MSRAIIDHLFLVNTNKLPLSEAPKIQTNYAVPNDAVRIVPPNPKVPYGLEKHHTVEATLPMGEKRHTLRQKIPAKYELLFQSGAASIKQAYMTEPNICTYLKLVLEIGQTEHFIQTEAIITKQFEDFFKQPEIISEPIERFSVRSFRDKKSWDIYKLEATNLHIATISGSTPNQENLPGWITHKIPHRQKIDLRQKLKKSLHYPFNIFRF